MPDTDIVERLGERIGAVHSHYISDDTQLLIDAKAELTRLRALYAEARAEVSRVRAYAFDYGNATGECSAGYLQHPNYICHKCNADDYRKGCHLSKAKE